MRSRRKWAEMYSVVTIALAQRRTRLKIKSVVNTRMAAVSNFRSTRKSTLEQEYDMRLYHLSYVTTSNEFQPHDSALC